MIKTGGARWNDKTTDVPSNHILLGQCEDGYMFDINVCSIPIFIRFFVPLLGCLILTLQGTCT